MKNVKEVHSKIVISESKWHFLNLRFHRLVRNECVAHGLVRQWVRELLLQPPLDGFSFIGVPVRSEDGVNHNGLCDRAHQLGTPK